MAKVSGGAPLLPEDLVIWEILIRLPVRSLLRCRAVCRSWRRRLTTDAKFLLAHHRRQPSLPLLTTWNECGDRTYERRIDTLHLRTGERHPVVRTSAPSAASEDHVSLIASCDGLVILRAYGSFEICNPATRERAPLTLLHGAACICALYPHRPSGSYRVLCCFKRAEDVHAVFHVHTVGSGELRCIGELPAPWSSGVMVKVMPMLLRFHTPALAEGKVYWQPLKPSVGNGKRKIMLVFDTMAESFQHLLSPVEGGGFLELFVMNNGALGLYHNRGTTADLWVLQDHTTWTWSLYNRIKLPAEAYYLMPVLNPEEDVLVVSARESGIYYTHLHHISGANGSLLALYEWNSSLILSRDRFKESLVRHDFFSMEGNDGGFDAKPLFDGLSTVALMRDDNSEPH